MTSLLAPWSERAVSNQLSCRLLPKVYALRGLIGVCQRQGLKAEGNVHIALKLNNHERQSSQVFILGPNSCFVLQLSYIIQRQCFKKKTLFFLQQTMHQMKINFCVTDQRSCTKHINSVREDFLPYWHQGQSVSDLCVFVFLAVVVLVLVFSHVYNTHANLCACLQWHRSTSSVTQK